VSLVVQLIYSAVLSPMLARLALSVSLALLVSDVRAALAVTPR
jgi:hypothetical protein